MELLHILHHEQYQKPSFKTFDQYKRFKEEVLQKSIEHLGVWEQVDITVTTADVSSLKQDYTVTFRFRNMAHWLEDEFGNPQYAKNFTLTAKEGTVTVAKSDDGSWVPLDILKANLKAEEKRNGKKNKRKNDTTTTGTEEDDFELEERRYQDVRDAFHSVRHLVISHNKFFLSQVLQ